MQFTLYPWLTRTSLPLTSLPLTSLQGINPSKKHQIQVGNWHFLKFSVYFTAAGCFINTATFPRNKNSISQGPFVCSSQANIVSVGGPGVCNTYDWILIPIKYLSKDIHLCIIRLMWERLCL